MTFLRLSVPLLFLFACRREPPPSPVSPPRPELPPLPNLVLAFRDELDREAIPSDEASPNVSLRWNLALHRDYRYGISQTVASYSSTRDVLGTSEIRSQLRGEGDLQILGTASGIGKGYYKMTLKESVVNGQRSGSEEINRQPPAKVEFHLRPSGLVEESKLHSGGEAQALEFLFRLPEEVGDRPYRSTGIYYQQGTISSGPAKFVRLESRLCARVETRISLDLSPATADDSGKGKMLGCVIGYFAVEEGRFLRIDAAFSFAYHTRQRYSKPGEIDRWNVGTTESHTLLKIRPQ